MKYGIRPEHLDAGSSAASPREVVVVEPMGAETELLVKVGEQTLTVITHGRSARAGRAGVASRRKPQHAHLFDAASGS